MLRSLITFTLLLTQHSLGFAQFAPSQFAPQAASQPWGNSAVTANQGFLNGLPQSYRSSPIERSRVVTIQQTQAPWMSPGHCGISTGYPAVCPPATCPPIECLPCLPCACDESDRRWAFDISALGLIRSDPASVGLLANPLSTTEAVNGGQFNFAAAAGIEAGLTFYNEFPSVSIELRGMFPDTWQSTVRESFTGTSVTVQGNPPLVTTGPRNSTSNYQSEFRSLMLNIKWHPEFTPSTTLALGLRSLTLDESLVSTLVDPNNVFPNEVVQSATDNNMFGIQFGVTHNLLSTPNVCITVDGRAGLFANDASRRSQLISLATPPVTFPASGADTEAAGLFEIGVEGKWKVAQCVNAVIGYRLIALQGVSLASDQLRSVDFLNQRGLDSDSTLVMESLTVGLELHY